MLYSILIFGDEGHVAKWTPEQEQEVVDRHSGLRRELTAAGRLGLDPGVVGRRMEGSAPGCRPEGVPPAVER